MKGVHVNIRRYVKSNRTQAENKKDYEGWEAFHIQTGLSVELPLSGRSESVAPEGRRSRSRTTGQNDQCCLFCGYWRGSQQLTMLQQRVPGIDKNGPGFDGVWVFALAWHSGVHLVGPDVRKR